MMPVSSRLFPSRLFLMLLPLLLLVGCSSIPVSGPVGVITQDADVDNPTIPIFNPSGPTAGDSADEILEAFITAGLGAADDYGVARQFLTDELAATWQPEGRVTIFAADPNVVPTRTEGVYQVQLEIVGSIDDRGIRDDSAATTTESIPVQMEQVDGEWRIADIPDGIMISQVDSDELLLTHSLYFYSNTYAHWVPDVRWFVNRQGIAANIVQAMLDGPAPYLQGAVISAFPESAELSPESVPIESGTATVGFTPEIRDVPNLQLRQMDQQLRANLTGLNTVNAVEMTAGRVPVTFDATDPELVVPETGGSVGFEQVAIFEDELVLYQAEQLSSIEGVPSIAEFSPRDPAMSINKENFAFLDGDRTRMLTTGPGREVREVVDGTGLTGPSFDPTYWTWVAAQGPEGASIIAVPPGGAEENSVQVAAPWLVDTEVLELRISRDGARALLVTNQAGSSGVVISGITRNVDGVPQSLSEPLELFPSGSVNTAKWVTEDTVVAAQTDPDEAVVGEFLFLGADPQEDPEQIAPLDGVVHISAGSGVEEVFAQTGDGMFRRVGNNSWLAQEPEGVRDPAFPG